MICIVCPMGCVMTVKRTESGFNVTGNTCKKGYTYAVDETLNPKRIVTSLARMCDGSVVPVKTSDTVPKGEVFEVLKKIKSVCINCDVHIGDVIIKNVCEGVDIVATDNMKH